MLAVVDVRIPKEAERGLMALGYKILKLPPHPLLASPVASHPDMLLFFAQNAVFCTEIYQKTAARELEYLSHFCRLPIVTIAEEVEKSYPRDILLNAAQVGNHLLCRPSHTSLSLTKGSGLDVIPTRQGYAKCSTLPVGGHALITEDASITAAAKQRGLDVLQIMGGIVRLEGYDTGFLGGATSFSPYGSFKQILFCGNLDMHPNAAQIKAFCKERGYDCISLAKLPLTDVGTIFLIDERI